MGSSLILKGGTTTPKTIEETISVSHSFNVGDVVRFNVDTGVWALAQANNADNSEVVGVIKEVQSGSFKIVYSGYIDLNSRYGSTTNPVLFLSAETAGALSESPPSAIGTVVKPVLTRKSGSGTGEFIVMNYLGTQIGGSSTVSIEEIQPVGTIMPYAAEGTVPETWLECNGVSYGVTEYPELYSALLNTTGDATPKYGSVVVLTGTGQPTVAVGSYVLFKTDATSSWNTAQNATNSSAAQVVGIVIGSTTTTITVQIQPNVSAGKFSYPNIQLTAGTGSNNTTLTGRYRIFANGTTTTPIDSSGYTVTSVSLTHFNLPDLRGRFALGVDTTSATTYPLANFGGESSNAFISTAATTTSGNTNLLTGSTPNPSINNIPPYLAVRWIIKAAPYTRAAIIDGVDIPYDQLLVGDLRSGLLRNAGVGEDLVFKTNTSVATTGTERMRLTNGGNLGLGLTNPEYALQVQTGGQIQGQIGFGSSTLGGLFGMGHTLNGDAYLYETQNRAISVGTNNTERLRINADGTIRTYGTVTGISGSLGIGPSIFTPAQSFHIKNAAPVIRLEDTDDGGYSEISANSSGAAKGALNISADAGLNGTDPYVALKVKGTERIRGTTTSVNVVGNFFVSATDSVDINCSSAGTINLGANGITVAARGNVHLGNQYYADRVTVEGNAHFSGGFTVGEAPLPTPVGTASLYPARAMIQLKLQDLSINLNRGFDSVSVVGTGNPRLRLVLSNHAQSDGVNLVIATLYNTGDASTTTTRTRQVNVYGVGTLGTGSQPSYIELQICESDGTLLAPNSADFGSGMGINVIVYG